MKFLSLLFVASSSVSAIPYRFGKIDGNNFKKYDLKDKQSIHAVSFSKMSSNLEKWGGMKMNIKSSKILIILLSSLLFSCNNAKRYSSHDPCPPLCHSEGYFSWHDSKTWILTENLKEQGISEIVIEKDPLLREGFLYVRFEVECSDLSVFSFPNISFDQTYHSNYDSKKVENFAKEKSIDFHQSISSDKTKLMGGGVDYSIVPTEDGSLPSKKYKGDLTYAFRVEGTLFDYAQDKTLENACFFFSPFIKGDNRYCVFAFQDVTLR